MNEWHNGTVKDRVGEIWVGDTDLGIVSIQVVIHGNLMRMRTDRTYKRE